MKTEIEFHPGKSVCIGNIPCEVVCLANTFASIERAAEYPVTVLLKGWCGGHYALLLGDSDRVSEGVFCVDISSSVFSGDTFLHVKNQTLYTVLAVAEGVASLAGKYFVVYRGEDGKIWCRTEENFLSAMVLAADPRGSMSLEQLAEAKTLPGGEDPFLWFVAPVVVIEKSEATMPNENTEPSGQRALF